MRPKKYFGQHFLTVAHYARRIAGAVPAMEGENVLEVGPGRGALSVYLKQRFPGFHLIEIDGEVIPLLNEKLGSGQWVLHRGDVLSFDYSQAGFPLHVVGNLPYSIGAHIIHKTLLCGNDIRSATFMVQREVAERICAGPGTRKNGYLSVFCRFFGDPKILFHVPPGAFSPKPKVESSVFQMRIESDPETRLPRDSWMPFFGFVDQGYRMRRKKLSNSLGDLWDRGACCSAMEKTGINIRSRAEELSLEQWVALYREFIEG